MEFAAPYFGWLCVPALFIVLLKVRGGRARREELRRFAEPHLLERLLAPQTKVKRWVGLLLPAAVMLLLVATLMRPQWGTLDEENTSSGIDVIFALDLSRSMLANDLAPSRLEFAKKAVEKALQSLPGDRVGVIGFAGSAFLLCPLTSDHEMVARVLAELDTKTLPKGGTALSSALVEAGRAFGKSPQAGNILVLLTDGEDQAGELAPAVNDLKQKGITVIASLTGSSSGALMPLGDGGFVKDASGAVVKSRADLASLQVIDSSASPLSGDPTALLARIQGVRVKSGEALRKERRTKLAERYALPLSAALAIWLPCLFFNRRGAWP